LILVQPLVKCRVRVAANEESMEQKASAQSHSQRNILILTHNYVRFPGDHAGHFVHLLARSLVGAGRRVLVLAPHEVNLRTFEMIDGVEVHRFTYAAPRKERLAYRGNMHQLVAESWTNKLLFLRFLLSFLRRALSLCAHRKVDLISAQWWIPAGLVGYVVSLWNRKPYVATSHGTDIRILEKGGLLAKIAGRVYRRAGYVTTVSSFLRDRLGENINLDPRKVRIIPMPVTPKTFSPTPLTNRSTKQILCVARFTPQKKLDVFLKACSLLRHKGIDFRAKIVGEGPLKEFLLEQIAHLGLENQVALVDTVPQGKLNLLYAESYVCVLPSVEEGFGLVLVEAQLCRRPVIGARSGGITDIIQDGISGLLVAAGDHQDLARAMERVLRDSQLALRLVEGGYQSALEKYSPQAVLKKYLEVLS
jgi:glycosyltransferase involved in cell wall biosynthesis